MDQCPHNTVPYPDDCKVNEFDKVRHSLWWAKQTLIAKGAVTAVSFFNPFKTEKYVDLWNTVGDVEDARALLDGDLEEAWGDLIGTHWMPTTTTQTVISPSCQSQLDDAYDQLAYLNGQLAQCQAQPNPSCGSILSIISIVQNQIAFLQTNTSCMVTVTNTTYVPVDNSDAPSDGFILESEMTTGAAGVPTYQNKKVNHMEVLNHPEMWKNFNLIFDSPTFFNTPPR